MTADNSILDRRALSLRDVLLILGMIAGFIGSYVAMDRRITILETKFDSFAHSRETAYRAP